MLRASPGAHATVVVPTPLACGCPQTWIADVRLLSSPGAGDVCAQFLDAEEYSAVRHGSASVPVLTRSDAFTVPSLWNADGTIGEVAEVRASRTAAVE
jgi:hypothetical protein